VELGFMLSRFLLFFLFDEIFVLSFSFN
jgi:hypothetical protein